MNMHARDIGQQFLIKLPHMLMMLDMRIENSHLAATDTCANIGHTIVVANGRMLIVRISIARLRSIPHNHIGILRFATNESAAGTIVFGYLPRFSFLSMIAFSIRFIRYRHFYQSKCD